MHACVCYRAALDGGSKTVEGLSVLKWKGGGEGGNDDFCEMKNYGLINCF